LHNASSTSATLTEYVGYFPVSSKILLTTSASPSFVGKAVTFAASVRSVDGRYGAIPDGELVWFYDGTTVLGSVPLAAGRAEYTTTALSAKTHTIKAVYPGNTIFRPSTNTVTQIVQKYPTTTARWSSLNPSTHGQAVTFTAVVTSSGPGKPTGKVIFKDGTINMGSAMLNDGVAKFTKSTLAVGTHTISASYQGDGFFTASTSPVLDQEVK
jgi:hypothetical protein